MAFYCLYSYFLKCLSFWTKSSNPCYFWAYQINLSFTRLLRIQPTDALFYSIFEHYITPSNFTPIQPVDGLRSSPLSSIHILQKINFSTEINDSVTPVRLIQWRSNLIHLFELDFLTRFCSIDHSIDWWSLYWLPFINYFKLNFALQYHCSPMTLLFNKIILILHSNDFKNEDSKRAYYEMCVRYLRLVDNEQLATGGWSWV